MYDVATARVITTERKRREYRRRHHSRLAEVARAMRHARGANRQVLTVDLLRMCYAARPCFLCGARCDCGHREPAVELAAMGVL